jgi:uncharacterized protein (DUF885 family)
VSAALDRLVDEYLTTIVEDYPAFATFLGIHERDGELGDFTLDGFVEKHGHMKGLLQKLDGLELSGESTDARIDAAVLRSALRESIFSYEELRPQEIMPSMYVRTAVGGCHSLIVRDFAPLPVRAESLVSRLKQVPAVLDAMKQNVTESPAIFSRSSLEAAHGGIAFLKSVIPGIAEQVPAMASDLEGAAAAAADALDGAAAHLARLEQGSTMPFHIGREKYDWLLREYLLLDLDAAALRDMGWEIIRQTSADMGETAREIDPARGWHEVMEDLKADHPAAGEVRETYAREMRRARDFVRANDLVTIPEGESLDVVDTPIFIRNVIPYAAYLPPGPFEGEQRGVFYVTPVDEGLSDEEQELQLRGHALHTIPVVALHEGYPGHHLQLVRANAVPRKVRKLVWCTVYGEGWALYCEEMMKEAGFYADARARLCQLKESLWRAARVVVDVGLQLGEMSVDDAIDFMMEHVRLERVNATAEVKRYTATPTQPSSYMIGKRAIMGIRDRYRQKAGSAFDLKTFHDDLLDLGNIQPKLVEMALGIADEPQPS